MFTTTEQVKELTGYEVPQETVIMAQAIVESFVGRVEAEVIDANDMMLLGRATAYQSAYMFQDESKIFEQIAAEQVMNYGNMVTFAKNGVSPWIAPLAVIACQRLTWKRIRSVRTGSIFAEPVQVADWRTE